MDDNTHTRQTEDQKVRGTLFILSLDTSYASTSTKRKPAKKKQSTSNRQTAIPQKSTTSLALSSRVTSDNMRNKKQRSPLVLFTPHLLVQSTRPKNKTRQTPLYKKKSLSLRIYQSLLPPVETGTA